MLDAGRTVSYRVTLTRGFSIFAADGRTVLPAARRPADFGVCAMMTSSGHRKDVVREAESVAD